ncbi:MAG: topoisomerase DNA-binding C4 zinc finger domain-containing protein [Coriobacteriia bacterium]|nr:topoisomerase DNA-binding C4 zinc finger domain-containing protein [Coriobacteriia bacterium]
MEVGLQQDEASAASPALIGSARICPNCGHALVMREARRGVHAGHKFLGCSNYPRCRHIEELPA